MTRPLEIPARGRPGEEGLLHLGPVALAAQAAGLGLQRGSFSAQTADLGLQRGPFSAQTADLGLQRWSCAAVGGALVLLQHRRRKRHRQMGLFYIVVLS